MISNLNIAFEYDGISYIIQVPTTSDNLPDRLRAAFGEIMRKSNVNVQSVIQDLIEDFGFCGEIIKQEA